jgi:Uma2 family endonuclease
MSKAQNKLPAYMTAEEFLRWEGDGTGRQFELVDGVLRAMAPAAIPHGSIQSQLSYLFRRHIIENKLKCTVVTAPGVQPRVNMADNVRMPYIAVSCAKIVGRQLLLPEPTVLVEILSPSNKAQTWTNVWTFTTILSVREILIVGSSRMEVKLLRRQPDGAWPDVPTVLDEASRLTLESLGLTVPVAEIYDGTVLE